MSLRELDPGSAWNEAERRAIPFGFVGFFLGGVVCALGLDPGIRDPFLAGICGAVGLFLANIAFLVGFYRKKLVVALIAAVLIAIFPNVITAFMLRRIDHTQLAFAPSIVVGMGLYFLLHRVHWTLSGLTFVTYVRQLAHDQHGAPKSAWERKVFWLLAALGAVTILMLLTKS